MMICSMPASRISPVGARQPRSHVVTCSHSPQRETWAAPARLLVAGVATLWMANVAHAAHAAICPNLMMAANGLQYCDEVIGTGPSPAAGSLIKAHYTGRLASTGAKFDSSYDRGRPLTFKVGAREVIQGWDLGILGTSDGAIPPMKEGGKRRLVIPSELAYGERGAGRGLIPGGAVLEFDVELVPRK